MTAIRLPALRGDDALGFLAAVGVLRLCSDELGEAAAGVGWPDGPWNGAVLECGAADSTGQLAEALFGVAESMRRDGRLLPGIDDYPLRAGDRGTTDPMNRRLSFEDGRGWSETALNRGRVFERWLRSTVSTSGVEPHKDDQTHWALVPSPTFDVGPGTVHMARTLAGALNDVVDRSTVEAGISRWRRVETVGAYLDHRADRNAAIGQNPRKDLPKYGEAGATWLALMATPLFEMRGTDRATVETVCWYARPRRMCWPVWSGILTEASVVAMLDHPIVRRIVDGRQQVDDPASLRTLGVEGLYRADRMMAGNYAAALGAARRIWPSPAR